MNREVMEFDVVIVGAGPAGLSASIRLAQLSLKEQKPLNICVIDKAASVGANILSGAVLEPRALNELLPDWLSLEPPQHTAVTEDSFSFLTKSHSITLPTPPQMNNHGNYIISLGQFCVWLAKQAEAMGINIFPGFAATEVLYEGDCVCGVATGDLGLDRKGEPKSQFQPGIELRAKQVIFAEGCRGSATQTLFKRFNLTEKSAPQTYGLGIKELWEIPPEMHQVGKVAHTVGWPLDQKTYGGAFLYHFGKNFISIGFVVGLDYENPYLNPYEEFQRFKTHPAIAPLLKNGRRIGYGGRTLIEGGLQSIPKLIFPGGLIIGDAAGFLNVPKIKGIHNAMKSGMIAAESLFPMLDTTTSPKECTSYPVNLKNSWLWKDLYTARNIRPAFRHGLWLGLAYAAIDTYLLRGRAPWTFTHRCPDHLTLKKAAACKKIEYPKHDNQLTFDLSTSVYLANIHYDEDQPYHLKLKDRHRVPIEINYKEYASPETRYCPAGVYEILFNEGNQPRLHINGANCVQCKACDIKDPTQNIVWTPSEGGSGPQYEMM
ncbi:MAG: electron transfer flavoprotein-ubiquinone oxidoreductase [Gammaproteobacteria bacterium]|nr:electron transfer flavoprotein-ubiquinone oxidoreductase [Gammaproteobacteria bacterium]